jgi:tetratricopeptide (TPR) repeat protein
MENKGMKRAWLVLFVLVLAGRVEAHTPDPGLPVFPPGYAESMSADDPLQPVLSLYRSGDYAGALFQAEEVAGQLSPLDPLAETVAFLLGDLHFKSVETLGGSEPLYASISAFQSAILNYRESQNAIRALIRMGEVYRALKFYPESLATFRRVLIKHPKSRFVLPARLGMADTYRDWGKLKETEDTYKLIRNMKLSKAERMSVNRGEADIAYQSGNLKRAYQKYREMGARPTDYGEEDRRTLFQFGQAAYQTGHDKQAREVLLAYYNTFSGDEMSPIALAQVGETWRRAKKDKGAGPAYESIRNTFLLMKASSPGEIAGKLLNEVGALGRKKECPAKLPQIRPSDCIPIAEAEGSGALPRGVKEVIALSRELIQAVPLLPVYQETIFSAARALRSQGLVDTPFELEDRLRLPRVGIEQTAFQKQVHATFRKTMQEVVGELGKAGGDQKVVDLFYRYPAAFSPAMKTGPTGMQVAESMTETGLPSAAAEIYEAIASTTRHAGAEEALARLAAIRASQGEQVDAHRNVTQFLARYPTRREAPSMVQAFGDLLAEEGETDLAIEKYRDWLTRYPGHPDESRVLLSLARGYVRKGALLEAAETYERFFSVEMAPTSQAYLEAADVSYELERYKDASGYYESALKADPGFSYAGWSELQLANSYRALGQIERSQEIYVRLSEQATDPVIKQLAATKARIFSGGQ